ncbi:MAG: DUF4440 domain-containing protein [Variibacter sp.]
MARGGVLFAAVALQLCLPALAIADEAEIRSRLRDWTASFNKRDKAAACDLFSKSLVSDVQGQGERNYAARCAIISKALDDEKRSFHYDLNIKDVIVDGTMAVVRLDWTLKISPGDSVSVESGLDVFRKEDDGRWRIIRYMAYTHD